MAKKLALVDIEVRERRASLPPSRHAWPADGRARSLRPSPALEFGGQGLLQQGLVAPAAERAQGWPTSPLPWDRWHRR